MLSTDVLWNPHVTFNHRIVLFLDVRGDVYHILLEYTKLRKFDSFTYKKTISLYI